MSARAIAFSISLAGSVASIGIASCTPTSGDKLQENLREFKNEQTPDKLFDRGRGFAQVGDWTRSEEYMSAALDAGGDARKIVPTLLEVCIQGQKYRVAIQYGQTYLRKYPDDLGTRFIVATLFLAIDDPASAKEHLVRVLAKQPDNADAHYALGVALRDADDDAVGADKQFREYLRLAPRGSHAKEASAGVLKTLNAQDADAGAP